MKALDCYDTFFPTNVLNYHNEIKVFFKKYNNHALKALLRRDFAHNHLIF